MGRTAKSLLVLALGLAPAGLFGYFMGYPGLNEFTTYPLPVMLAYVGCAVVALLMGPVGMLFAVLGRTPDYSELRESMPEQVRDRLPEDDPRGSGYDSLDDGSLDDGAVDDFDNAGLDDDFGESFDDAGGFDDGDGFDDGFDDEFDDEFPK